MNLFFRTFMFAMVTLLAASVIALGVDSSVRNNSLFYGGADHVAAAERHAEVVQRVSLRTAELDHAQDGCVRSVGRTGEHGRQPFYRYPGCTLSWGAL